MKITIEHCRYAPKWETLNKMLKEVLADPDGRLSKIDRVDGGVDYHATGRYNLEWDDRRSHAVLPITLVCVPVGKSSE